MTLRHRAINNNGGLASMAGQPAVSPPKDRSRRDAPWLMELTFLRSSHGKVL